MPIESTINTDEKIIYTVCKGLMTPDDFNFYIKNIWGTQKNYGFNELFDTIAAD